MSAGADRVGIQRFFGDTTNERRGDVGGVVIRATNRQPVGQVEADVRTATKANQERLVR